MPIQPYVLVLAQTSHEGAKYVRRAKLPRGRWRVVAKASSIRGIRKAEVHCLPGFHKRPDRHSILGELRYAQCEWRDVEMPEAEVPDAVDQGDGMGEQLTIEHALTEEIHALAHLAAMGDDEELTEAVEAKIEHNEQMLDAVEAEVDRVAEYSGVPAEAITGKSKRRRKCADCGTMHFKDEACVRTDGVIEDAPATAPAAVLFD